MQPQNTLSNIIEYGKLKKGDRNRKKNLKNIVMFIVCLMMFIAFIGIGVYSAMNGHKPQMIGAFMLALIALFYY